MKKNSYSLFLVLVFVISSLYSYSATFYSRTSGNWTTNSTWSTVACGGVAATSIPGAGDNVIICAGHTITMNGNPANCLSLTLRGTASWTTSRTINIGTGGFTMVAGSSVSGLGGPNSGIINVAGNFTVNSGGTSTFDGGTITVTGTTNILGTFAISATSGTKTFQDVNITGGSFTSNANEIYAINGNLVMTAGTITGSSTGVYNIGGSLTVAAGTSVLGAGTLTVTGTTTINGTLNENSVTGTKTFSNIIINSGATWNNLSAETYDVTGNLTMNGGTITGTAAGRYDIAGSFIVASGTNTLGQSLLTVTAPTTINATLNITSTTGTKTFGDFAITSAGNWNCSVAEDFTINGNFSNNGIFTSGSGIYTLAGTGKTISGSVLASFVNISNTGSYTNNGMLQVTGAHTGGGTFSQGTTGSYFNKMLSANFTVTVFNASAAGNLVTYNYAGAQNIRTPNDGSYYHLTTAGSGIKTMLAATTVGGNLIISSGSTLNSNNFNLIAKGDFTNNGSFTAGTATVTFSGTALQTIGGSVVTAFRNLTVSNNAGISLVINTSASGVLTFTAGVITTGTYKVTITSTGSVSGAATSRFVNGYLEKNISTGAGIARTFEVGSGTTDYLPLALNFTSVSAAGNITVHVTNGDHSSITSSCIDELKSVNRFWSITNSGVAFTSYSAAATFIGSTDIDAGSTAANYYMSLYNSGVWTILTRGTVAATSNQGTGLLSVGDLQIGERRTPVIPVQPVGDTVCNNTAATFSLTVTGVGLSYQWQQNSGSGFVNVVNGGIYSGATTSTLTINPAVNSMNGYQYQCVISNTCGTAIVVSNSAVLTVTPNVTASVSVSSTLTTICAGTSVTFTAVPVNGGATPIYQWTLNGANTGSNSSTYASSTLNNGDQVACILTSNALCVLGSPATSNTIVMTVNPNLPASLSIAASSTTICPGTLVTFTATPVNGGTTPSYQWLLNGANVGSNSTSYSNSTLLNGDVVSCTLTSNAVCVTGSPASSNSITMIVNPALPVSVSIAASPSNIICSGDNVTFTATPVNGGATPSYQWQLNGVNTGSNASAYSTAALVNGDVVSCILTSAATCATGSPATSNTITMTVNVNLPVSVSISESPSGAICSGTSVLFTASSVNGGTTPAYQWQINGVNAGTNSTTFSSSSLANGDNVTCVLTSSATCATGNPATSNSIVMVVNPNLPVSVSVGSSPAGAICAGTNVIFTASPVNGGTIPSYQWQLNGANVGSNSSTYSNATLVNGDVITCTLTSNAVCATGNPATSAAITMTVNPNLPVSVSIAASPAAVSCSGTAVVFTAGPVNGGSSPTYQWLLNGGNVGTNSSTYSSSALVNGDVISCVLTSNAVCPTGNPATSNSITQTVVGSGNWLGAVSTDWNNASNWCGGIPVLTSNISITSGTPFSPVLTGSSSCKNIAISAGATVNLNNNVLNVYGIISGTGVITGSSSSSLNIAAGAGSAGTIYMDQSAPGTSNAVAVLTLNRTGSSVALGNQMNVVNTVNVSAGTLNTGGNLILVSNASGTARISNLVTGADVSGNITMQRYIPGGTDGWMFLGAPVSGATLVQWDDDFITGGFPGSFYPPSPNPSIVTYDETVPGLYDSGYVAPSGITDAIVPRVGYWAYIMGTPLTIDVTGALLKNNQTFSLTYTNDVTQPATENGWNLLSNPYPSTIDWDAPGWTKTNLNDAIYMYSPTLDEYTSYVGGIGTNGGTNLIASSQAFLVQAAGPSPVLKMNETVKDATDEQFIRTPSAVDDIIRLNVVGAGYKDETVIHFNSLATDNFDNSYDALKFFSFNTDAPGIASLLDSVLLSVNTFAPVTSDLSIPVKVKVGISGTYTIQLDITSVLPSLACLVLEDLKTGIQTDLLSSSSYSFYIADTTAFPRFLLKIGKPLESFAIASTCSSNNNGMASIAGNGTGPWDYEWKDGSGVIVQTHTGIMGADSLLNIEAGTYTVHISGNSGACNEIDASIIVSAGDTLFVNADLINSSCSNSVDGSIQVLAVEGGIAPYTYNWSNGSTGFQNTNLSPGMYTLTVTDSAGCELETGYTISAASDLLATFDMSNDTIDLNSDEALELSTADKSITSFIWNFGDGTALNYSPNPSYLYPSAGTYTVTLVASNGTCTDSSSQIVVVEGTSIATGINEEHANSTITLAANNEVVDLSFSMDRETAIEVEVYSVSGQKVMPDRTQKVFRNKLSYDFSSLSPGVYYFTIHTGNGKTYIKKFAKL
jgi:hypothetical protein